MHIDGLDDTLEYSLLAHKSRRCHEESLNRSLSPDKTVFSFYVFTGLAYSFMYVTISVVILQYFDKKKSFANGIALCGSGIHVLIII